MSQRLCDATSKLVETHSTQRMQSLHLPCHRRLHGYHSGQTWTRVVGRSSLRHHGLPLRLPTHRANVEHRRMVPAVLAEFGQHVLEVGVFLLSRARQQQNPPIVATPPVVEQAHAGDGSATVHLSSLPATVMVPGALSRETWRVSQFSDTCSSNQYPTLN